MSVKDRIERELKQAAQVYTATGSLPSIHVDVDTGHLLADLTALDQLACAFTSLTFESSQLAATSMDQLKRIAADLASRLSYLLEPISEIETDEESCVVQMRSNPPAKDDDGSRFYELVVEKGRLSLCRYAKLRRQPREVVSAEVTREVLVRLAGDFRQAVQ